MTPQPQPRVHHGLAEPMGYLSYEPIARLETGAFTYLFAPVEVLITIVLAGLVATTVALSYLGFVQPTACGLTSSTGILAGVPAVFSGAACCGPVILTVIGLQATGTMLTAFKFLIPVAVVLLIGSLVLIGRQVDPAGF